MRTVPGMTLSTIPFDQFVQKLLYKVVLLAFYIFQSMTFGRAAASCNVQSQVAMCV